MSCWTKVSTSLQCRDHRVSRGASSDSTVTDGKLSRLLGEIHQLQHRFARSSLIHCYGISADFGCKGSYAVPSDRVVDADYYARAVRNRRLSDPASGRPRRAAGSPDPVIQVVGRITASDTQLKSLLSFYGIIRHFARRRHRVYFWNSTFQWLSPMKQEA